ncbi:MAG: hypothetical protein PHZ19_01785 [Candidatus Thermoplasmatota archaeon]|nr:hypothetical protein [Candidatus Thermoplasmatota archaeon]
MAVGLNQTLEYALDEGYSTWVRFDRATGGSLEPDGGGPEHDDGVTGQDEVWRGMYTPGGNAETTVMNGELLQYAVPTAIGELPPVINGIRGGVIADADAAKLNYLNYLSSLELSCEEQGLLKATYAWLSRYQEYTTIAAAADALTTNHFPWHPADVQLDIAGAGLAAYRCTAWTVTVETGITAQTSQDAAAAGQQRQPQWIDPGIWVCRLTCSLRTPPGLILTADFVDTIEFQAVLEDRAGRKIDIDLTGGNGLHVEADPIPIVVGGDPVGFEITAESANNDFDIFSVTGPA